MNQRAGQPIVVVFHCDGGSLASASPEPVQAGAGFIRVPCVGRVSAGDVLRALRSGVSGVLLAGCAPGACRFHDAASHAADVATDLAPVLQAMGLGAERVRYAPTGRGPELTAAVASFVERVQDYEVMRPEAAEVVRLSALMDALPPYPHHGVVQEAALLSHMRHDAPSWPTWAEGAAAGAETLLYVCDLPLLNGLIGRHFPANTLPTLESCMALLARAGVPVSVVPSLPCCGHDFGIAGNMPERAHEARRVKLALTATGARRVVVVSPECQWHLKEGFAALGVVLEPEVVSLIDLLYERRDSLVPDAGRGADGRTVLYVGDAPAEGRDRALELLAAVGAPPLAVVPREFAGAGAQLQGSAGVKGFVNCDGDSRAAQDRLLGEAAGLGATTLITLSVTAAIHLTCAQRRGSWRRSSVRVQPLFDYLAARLAWPAGS